MLTEATFEVLPRLNEIKFGSGVIDELLFLDLPQEGRYTSGLMVVEYGRAIQETVYEQLRVVREGHLRVIFTPDLKVILFGILLLLILFYFILLVSVYSCLHSYAPSFRYYLGNFVFAAMKNFFLEGWLHPRYEFFPSSCLNLVGSQDSCDVQILDVGISM